MAVINSLNKCGKRSLMVIDCQTNILAVVVSNNTIFVTQNFDSDVEVASIVQFGKKNGATGVVFMQLSDIRELDIKLSSDLDESERQSAIEYAAESAIGDDSLRVTYLDKVSNAFKNGIFASWVDTDEIKVFDKLAKANKLKFYGISNLRLAMLAQHFSNSENRHNVLLSLSEKQGFMAIPEQNKLIVRNLSFGTPDFDNIEDWRLKAERRLGLLKGRRVTICSSNPTKEGLEEIKNIANPSAITEAEWSEVLSNTALFAFSGGKNSIKPAQLPPKAKDPKAAGTVIALIMLGMVTLSMGILLGKNIYTKIVLEQRLEEYTKIASSVSAEQSKLKSLESELALERELLQLFKSKHRVSKTFMAVANLLRRYPLQYSRITMIEERSTGIHIAGETLWQPDLSKFLSHFEEELKQYDLRLFPDGLSNDADGKIKFQAHITGEVK